MISSVLPNITQYQGIRKDILAGLTVAIMIIPQGMAYALLAGLPAIYGLYGAFVPLLIYPFFGTSKQLSVGPVALVSIIVLAGVSQWAEPGSREFIELALLTSLVAGLIQIGFAMIRMGFMVKFLSEPVIAGFTTAAALIIGLSQFKYFLGIEIGPASDFIGIIKGLVSSAGAIHWSSFILGTSAIACIVLAKKASRKIPGALIAVILGALAVFIFQLDRQGVAIVGDVPKGLPAPTVAFLDLGNIVKVAPLALVICLISFIESLAIAKTIAIRHQNYPIDANKELLGLGMAKLIGSFFLAFPNTGSFTRSAINDDAGAHSGYSSIFAGLFLGIILLFCTPLFYYLPKPVLGAIVIAAVYSLIHIKQAYELIRISKRDFTVFMTTCILTLMLGIQEGVFVGIFLSLVMIVHQASSPHLAILGKLPGTNSFRNIDRYPEAIAPKGYLIVRYDENIYFANANHFLESIVGLTEAQDEIHTVILNCASIIYLDTTGISKVNQLMDTLNKRGISLLFTNIRGPVRDLFDKCGISDRIGFQNNYLTITDAIEGHISKNGASELSRLYASQISTEVKEKI